MEKGVANEHSISNPDGLRNLCWDTGNDWFGDSGYLYQE